jgi:hypothetical protein
MVPSKNFEKELSIIVPIHRVPNLEGQERLLSWVHQVPNTCEIVFSLDLCEDESVKRWSMKNLPRDTKFTEGKFGNPGETRNNAKALSRGEWVAFVDFDDSFDCSSALSAISDRGSESDLLICRYDRINIENGEITETIFAKHLSELLIELGFWRIIYRSKLAKEINFPPTRMGEDQVFFSRVLARNPRISFCSQKIYRYSLGEKKQLTMSTNYLEDLEESIALIEAELRYEPLNRAFRRALVLRMKISLEKKFRQSNIFVIWIKVICKLSSIREVYLYCRSTVLYVIWKMSKRRFIK